MASFLLLDNSLAAFADEYPDRPICLAISHAAGSSDDIIARQPVRFLLNLRCHSLHAVTCRDEFLPEPSVLICAVAACGLLLGLSLLRTTCNLSRSLWDYSALRNVTRDQVIGTNINVRDMRPAKEELSTLVSHRQGALFCAMQGTDPIITTFLAGWCAGGKDPSTVGSFRERRVAGTTILKHLPARRLKLTSIPPCAFERVMALIPGTLPVDLIYRGQRHERHAERIRYL